MKGHSDVENLYVIGESACTGLHGANRMASNSLLECLVFATAAATDIEARLADSPPPPELPEWDESKVTDSDEEVVVSHNWDELRRFMWDYVGIVRTDKRLQRAAHRALYRLLPAVRAAAAAGAPHLLEAWRRLSTSDHFFYMATKDDTDGYVHARFSPFGGPQRAFVAHVRATEALRRALTDDAAAATKG